jgi:hypothetical protein
MQEVQHLAGLGQWLLPIDHSAESFATLDRITNSANFVT